MNNAPFKIGQRVVALITDITGKRIKKGSVYTVLSIKEFCKCGSYVIDIGMKTEKQFSGCLLCGHTELNNAIIWIWTGHFAPIDDQKERIRYVAVSESLREKAVEIAAVETN